MSVDTLSKSYGSLRGTLLVALVDAPQYPCSRACGLHEASIAISKKMTAMDEAVKAGLQRVNSH